MILYSERVCSFLRKIVSDTKQIKQVININNIYKSIASDESLSVIYEPNFEIISFADEELRKNLTSIYKKNYKKELNYGVTLYGPHRDDYSFYLNDINLKYFGSQGQQKIAILSYKLSEIDIFKSYSDTSPVLLLDDIFSELDIEKRNKLLDLIGKDIQSIITTTDLKNIRKKRKY